MTRMALKLALLALGAGAGTPATSNCRCRLQDGACWPAPAAWSALNASLAGALIEVPDELDSCIAKGASSTECAADLGRTDDEFFYTGQVGGFMHTGLAAGGGQAPWSIAHNQSAYAVAAQRAEDVALGVQFAAKHDLRLSVKGTGHDWFGRSGSHPDFEGGLLIWTHKMKKTTWHDGAFVAENCAADSGVADAVTLEAGLQFADFYPEAEQRGRLVNGGTCTSVGVGGCTLGGCFGPFSQKLGPAASNVLQAKVVLANGSLVTASKCSHPELFWALRGGGAGYGVVTEWTMRAQRPLPADPVRSHARLSRRTRSPLGLTLTRSGAHTPQARTSRQSISPRRATPAPSVPTRRRISWRWRSRSCARLT
jgi:hypothetical protein